jgi:hypothetical protein
MSNFRIWLQKIWMQHKEETFIWTGSLPEYRMAYYVSKYRWWLRREYRYQNQHGERTDQT